MATGIPTNRSNLPLPNAVSSEILQKTQESSAVMQLARKIPLPGQGVQIPVITSDPVASWVTETGTKPVSNPGLNKKVMQAHKLAVIIPFSDEFKRDMGQLYNALVERLPNALGLEFDKTVFFGPASTLANFDDFSEVTAQSLSGTGGVYGGLVAADTDISEQGGMISGYVFSPQGRGMLLNALDKQNRPIFINNVSEGSVPKILGASTYFRKVAYKEGTAGTGSGSGAGTPDIVGFAGDWSHAMWGTVEGIKISFADQASLTVQKGTSYETINLFQQNMFAVRAEIEVGFVAETAYFNALTRTHAAS